MAKFKFDFKKIDLTRVKQFFVARGEKVGLALILGIGALVVTSGLLSAWKSDGKAKTDALRANINTIRTALNANLTGKLEETVVNTRWDPVESWFNFTPLVGTADTIAKKRARPTAASLLLDKKSVQFDYLKGAAVQVYSVVDRDRKLVEVVGKSNELVTTLSPRRLLIVSTFFPMQEQLAEFQTKLGVGKDSLKDDFPHLLGVDVIRVEKDPATNMVIKETELFVTGPKKGKDDKDDEEKPRPKDDKKGDDKKAEEKEQEMRVAEHIKDFLQFVHIDEDALKPFAAHRKAGLMMLMPKLTNVAYPPLELKKFVGKKEAEKPSPAKKGSREGGLETVAWTKLGGGGKGTGSIADRFEGKFPVFDGQLDARPPGNGKPTPVPGKSSDPDPLIRFFDVDVEPGHTYEYKIRPRLYNPNYQKTDEVAVDEDSDDLELFTDYSTTPMFTVPPLTDEVAFYACDQWERKPDYPAGPDHTRLDDKTARAPLQIHRWFGEALIKADRYAIIDWVVAERILVRRGEYIGRRDISVPVCTWSKLKDDFEVINPPKAAVEDKVLKKVTPPAPAGIKLNFAVTDAMLVDFDGGLRIKSGVRGKIEEEAVMDLLILGPDGKLQVHNTHRDFNLKARVDQEREYRERIERYVGKGPAAPPENKDKKEPPKEKGKSGSILKGEKGEK